MPAIRRQTTLANRTGVVFALNTPMREIRYLQTRILTGIQAIDQFILMLAQSSGNVVGFVMR